MTKSKTRKIKELSLRKYRRSNCRALWQPRTKCWETRGVAFCERHQATCAIMRTPMSRMGQVCLASHSQSFSTITRTERSRSSHWSTSTGKALGTKNHTWLSTSSLRTVSTQSISKARTPYRHVKVQATRSHEAMRKLGVQPSCQESSSQTTRFLSNNLRWSNHPHRDKQPWAKSETSEEYHSSCRTGKSRIRKTAGTSKND